MNISRRQFLGTATAAAIATQLPAESAPTPAREHFGQHLAFADYGTMPVSNFQRAFGQLSYGARHPKIIMSSRRVMGNFLDLIIPRQRVYDRLSSDVCGFVMCGALWIWGGNDPLAEDKIQLWHLESRHRGWYYADERLTGNPRGDEVYANLELKARPLPPNKKRFHGLWT